MYQDMRDGLFNLFYSLKIFFLNPSIFYNEYILDENDRTKIDRFHFSIAAGFILLMSVWNWILGENAIRDALRIDELEKIYEILDIPIIGEIFALAITIGVIHIYGSLLCMIAFSGLVFDKRIAIRDLTAYYSAIVCMIIPVFLLLWFIGAIFYSIISLFISSFEVNLMREVVFYISGAVLFLFALIYPYICLVGSYNMGYLSSARVFIGYVIIIIVIVL